MNETTVYFQRQWAVGVFVMALERDTVKMVICSDLYPLRGKSGKRWGSDVADEILPLHYPLREKEASSSAGGSYEPRHWKS